MAGGVQVKPASQLVGEVHCQDLREHPNGREPSLMSLVIPVLFLLWRVKMTTVKKVCLPRSTRTDKLPESQMGFKQSRRLAKPIGKRKQILTVKLSSQIVYYKNPSQFTDQLHHLWLYCVYHKLCAVFLGNNSLFTDISRDHTLILLHSLKLTNLTFFFVWPPSWWIIWLNCWIVSNPSDPYSQNFFPQTVLVQLQLCNCS